MIIAAFIALLGGFVRGISGFGFAIIAAPLLLFVFDPKSVVIINLIIGFPLGLLLLFYTRQHIDLKRMLCMCGGSIFGIPIGVYFLSSLNPTIIKLAIAGLIIPFAIILLLGHSHQFKRDSLGCTISGFISGLVVSSTSLGGPPVVLFLLNQGLVKERLVGTLTAFFLFTGIVSVSTFSALGMVTVDLLIKVAILLPAAIVGFYIGIKLLPKINPILFRRIATSIVCVAALTIIITFILEAV